MTDKPGTSIVPQVPRSAGAVSSTPIEPGMIQRIVGGMQLAVTGRPPSWLQAWFGPNEPMKPVAPPETAGRAFDYPAGYNLNQKPRAYEPVSFEQLRALGDSYDLLRLAIETRKDQMGKLSFSIEPKMKPGQVRREKPDERCAELEKFWAVPDREHGWQTWLRMVLEDLFVIDAPSIYVRKNLAGGVYSLDILDGATIKRVIDDHGRTPVAPAPAYQQVLKGLPAIDYSRDELIYKPRNPRSNKIYGYSPVEQIIMTVNIAIRRQIHQLQFYTEGNVPEALLGVPETWTPDQISAFQRYWDTILEGNTAQRRHLKFVPGGMTPIFTRDPMLKDEYDEWLARVICYCFSLPPLPFVKQMNRATAQTSYDAALEEGLEPLMLWVKELVDTTIAKYWGWADLELVWADVRKVSPQERAQIDATLVRAGIKGIDESRQDLGLDPTGMPPALFGYGPLGVMLISDFLDPVKREQMMNASAAMGPAGQMGRGVDADPLQGIPASVLEAVGLAPPAPPVARPLAGVPDDILHAVGLAGLGALAPEDQPEDDLDPLDGVPADVLGPVGLTPGANASRGGGQRPPANPVLADPVVAAILRQ